MAASKKKKSPIRVGIWGLGRAGWSMHCSEIANQPVGCGLLSLEEPAHRQAAVEEAFRGLGLEQLMETALAEVAAQKGVAL